MSCDACEHMRIYAVVALENIIVTLEKEQLLNERLDWFLGYLANILHARVAIGPKRKAG